MNLTTWLPGMFTLGIVSMGLPVPESLRKDMKSRR